MPSLKLQRLIAIILGAGESSRFWPLNQKHKSLFKIMGRPLICYLLNGLEKAGLSEIIFIQNQTRDVERELQNFKFPRLKLKYLIQQKPTGTGDAILIARKLIKDQFLVLNAERVDCQNYIKLILEKSKKEKTKAILLSSPTETPWLFGNLKIKGNKVLDIIEKPKKEEEFSNLKNVGFYFLPKEFLDYLKKEPAHHHSLIRALSKYAKERELKIVKIEKEPISLKYPWNLFNINEYLLKKIKTKILGKIEKNCQIKGPLIVEKGSLIKSGSYIEGPVYIGKNCQIGPNCYIRSFTSIGSGCKIGSGGEIKNSIIGDNSKISHLNYLGDSIIGENCNLGAGTIAANLRFDNGIIKSVVKGEKILTGLKKLGVVIGEKTKIGINASLMPGTLIGSNSIIGPHSVVFENVKDNTIFYTKFDNIVKEKFKFFKN